MPKVQAVKPTLARAVSVRRKTFAQIALGLYAGDQSVPRTTSTAEHILA